MNSDDLISFQSWYSFPRLGTSTWMPTAMIDKQPWVEIDFRKPALVKAIKLLSPSETNYPALFLAKSFSRVSKLILLVHCWAPPKDIIFKTH